MHRDKPVGWQPSWPVNLRLLSARNPAEANPFYIMRVARSQSLGTTPNFAKMICTILKKTTDGSNATSCTRTNIPETFGVLCSP